MKQTFLDRYRVLGTWNEKIEFIRKLKNIPGTRFRRAVIQTFRMEICNFNRGRKMNQEIRSIATGRFIGPSSRSYLKTLRACNLVRHYETCSEFESSDKHPVRNRRVYKPRERRNIIRKCNRLTK